MVKGIRTSPNLSKKQRKAVPSGSLNSCIFVKTTAAINADIDTRKLTVAEFHQIEFDDADTHLYELLDGDLVKKKAPLPGIS